MQIGFPCPAEAVVHKCFEITFFYTAALPWV